MTTISTIDSLSVRFYARELRDYRARAITARDMGDFILQGHYEQMADRTARKMIKAASKTSYIAGAPEWTETMSLHDGIMKERADALSRKKPKQ